MHDAGTDSGSKHYYILKGRWFLKEGADKNNAPVLNPISFEYPAAYYTNCIPTALHFYSFFKVNSGYRYFLFYAAFNYRIITKSGN